MKLYNTRTKQTDEIKPLDDGQISMYSCGPTVYDHIHIGNLSSFIFADTLRRTLASQYKVKHVMNFTDVDDKTIRRSREQYPDLDPLEALQKLTTTYSEVFLQDMAAVGNDVNAISFVKATESIDGLQRLIATLHKQGFAYIADDGVYFSIDAYRKSGKTYGQLLEISKSSTSEARIDNDEYDKESAHDFALWKKQKAGEPAWSFELDQTDLTGRPGWHIECSAMSEAALGLPFDIHTGGIDLIFPHHENEIAQSTAGRDDVYATVFAHNEHLLVDGKKMSKSLNNFHTLATLADKGFNPLAFRVLVLQAHYRNQAHFSWENLEAAQNRLKELQAMAVLRHQALPIVHDSGTFTLEDVPIELASILADDLNTPQALAFLSQISTQLNTVLIERDMVDHFENMLTGIDALLGLQLLELPDISAEQKELIRARETARENKDWQQSDSLRDELLAQGIAVRDTSEGSIWAYA